MKRQDDPDFVITSEALDAFERGDRRALHDALGWPDWQDSPLDVRPGGTHLWYRRMAIEARKALADALRANDAARRRQRMRGRV